MTLSGNSANPQRGVQMAQIVFNKLYFASIDVPPVNTNQVIYINIDQNVHYDAFYDDFGPLNLAVLFRFCESLHAIVQSKNKRKVVTYTSTNPRNRVNGVYLIASYVIIYHNLTADEAYVRFQAVESPPFVGFRDAAMGHPTYLLHVQHVVRAVEKALQHKWLDFKTFDPDEYEYYERVENGDLNWIVPNKILSFCGPHDRSYTENEYCYHAPEVYFNYFRSHNVSTIIRLNKKVYDAKRFTNAGFDHCDLFFIDGSTPSDEIVLKFIDIVENARGAVAIHCKAGLGRTGTLIACWMMKNFKLTAPQCMAWLRICRPGSVIGPQQQFLLEKQHWCWKLGQQKSGASVVLAPLSESNDGIHPNNIKCKITNNNTPTTADSPLQSKSKVLVTHLANELDYFGPCDLKNNNAPDVGDADAHTPPTTVSETDRTPNGNLPYLLRSKKSGVESPLQATTGNADGVVDETAVNEYGQSQGDRLCEKKAKAQHKVHNPSLVQFKIDDPAHEKATVDPEIVTPFTTNTLSAPRAVPRYSSATTPIKQLKLFSSQRIQNSSATDNASMTGHLYLNAYRTLNMSKMPISKVTVSTNYRPTILRGSQPKNARIKPYTSESRMGGIDTTPKYTSQASSVGGTKSSLAKSFSGSNVQAAFTTGTNGNYPDIDDLAFRNKYHLRPRFNGKRFDPAATLAPGSKNMLSSPTSKRLIPVSKSASRVM